MKFHFILPAILLLGAPTLAEVAKAPNVQVTYEGIDVKYAQAIAQTLSAAREIYIRDFGADMPQTIVCSVTCGDGQPTRLFTDGKDHVTLNVSSPEKLLHPAKSGVFNLYGMCHELGHVAMYRVLKDRDWMSTGAAEGWAHYAGSVVVDRVYAAKGQNLWPDAYDYRQDGMARLKRQLTTTADDQVTLGAEQWLKLEAIISLKGFPKLFAAWQEAGIDASKPDSALLGALIRLDEAKAGDLANWWKFAGKVLVQKTNASGIAASTIAKSKLSGKAMKLAGDDDSADGKSSIAGGGHARIFETLDAGNWYIVAVWIHGGRYGPVRAPDTQFDIALCEPDLKAISTWKKPYAAFPRGDSKWMKFDVAPTRVPKKFAVCLNFRPTATNGVYVSYDSSTQGNSLVGIPGKPGEPFDKGDWMIRVEVDQAK